MLRCGSKIPKIVITPASDDEKDDDDCRERKICVLGQLIEDRELLRVAHTFGFPVVLPNTKHEIFREVESTIYITDEFSDLLFSRLKEARARILGPTALIEVAVEHHSFSVASRPRFCLSMYGLKIVFTKIRPKERLAKLVFLVQSMGASVQRTIDKSTTHLVTNMRLGDTYKYAAAFEITIMLEEWVYKCWERRYEAGFKATNESMLHLEFKLFSHCYVRFYGFTPEQKSSMVYMLEHYGGVAVEREHFQCTHLVVNESEINEIPENVHPGIYIVTSEWFNKSLATNEYLNEKDFGVGDVEECGVVEIVAPFQIEEEPEDLETVKPIEPEDNPESLKSTNPSKMVPSVEPGNFGTYPYTKNEQRRKYVHVNSQDEDIDDFPYLPKQDLPTGPSDTPSGTSKRFLAFQELVKTESNYVGILQSINNAKDELVERNKSGTSSIVIEDRELKIIFGNLQPIYEVHKKMLQELMCAEEQWTEETLVGNILLKYMPDMLKAYPPYVNNFEDSKNKLMQCGQENINCYAYLRFKLHGRENICDLMIRPIQRLGSISLLLKSILKHTDKNNPDYSEMENSLVRIKEILSHINEDKKQTERFREMFEIFNTIDNCPADLISSHRNLVSLFEVVELTDGLCGRGENLVMLLFSDVLEVCRKKSQKSPTPFENKTHTFDLKTAKPRQLKHVGLLQLSNIQWIEDMQESEKWKNAFCLVFNTKPDMKISRYFFNLLSGGIQKEDLLKIFCKQMSNTACTTYSEDFLKVADPEEFNLNTASQQQTPLNKATRFVYRTRSAVTHSLYSGIIPHKLRRVVSNKEQRTKELQQEEEDRTSNCGNPEELAFALHGKKLGS